MIKAINLAIVIAATVGVSAASAESYVKTLTDPAMTQAMETIHGMVGKKSAGSQVTKRSPKVSRRSTRNLDKVLILGGAEAFPM